MKKRYVLFACMLLSLAAAGCSGKSTKDQEEMSLEVQTTVAPVQEEKTQEEPEAEEEDELVYMQKTVREKEENVIGTRSETAAKLTITNQTGAEVSSIYIRPHTENYYDSDWGMELVQEAFTLKNGEKAIYYFETDQTDDYGNAVSLYDIRISYKEAGKNECFFRKLPLNTISQIHLCMEGTGTGGIPYAKYISSTSDSEVSTLNEVKQRLGYGVSEEDDDLQSMDIYGNESSSQSSEGSASYDDSSTDSDFSQSGEDSSQSASDESGVTGDDSSSENVSGDTGTEAPLPDSDSQVQMDAIAMAQSCVVKTLDELISIIGEPTGGSDYENEPESGETGYHYYDNFTISTTFDENQNEIVDGVW